MTNHSHLDDEESRLTIKAYLDQIESFVQVARENMQPGGWAKFVNSSMRMIAFSASQAQEFQWPDLEARALTAAKQDRSLQKLFKKASRKTPI